MADNDDILGRKIFFLHPSALIKNQIIEELIQQEFEVYAITQADKLRRVLKQFPTAIVFANINDGMSPQEWETWIRGVRGDPALKGVSVGILCSGSGDDEALKAKYLGHIKIQCGYTVLKSNFTEVFKTILEILRTADAKGRRKFIRADTTKENNVTVNFPVDGNFVNGVIRDISVVGFSCAFDTDPAFTKNELFQQIQIRLQSSLLKAEGIVFGNRDEGKKKIYVVIFTQRINPEMRAKIRKYIQGNLQTKMDALMRTV